MRAPIVVKGSVVVPESAIVVTAARASGPGGQNVNKVSSKVYVSVDLAAVSGLDLGARERLGALALNRLDATGRFQVVSQKTRDQGRNIEDAYGKIRELIAMALVAPKPRRKTRPSRGAVRRRLEDKRQTAATKQGRSKAARAARTPHED